MLSNEIMLYQYQPIFVSSELSQQTRKGWILQTSHDFMGGIKAFVSIHLKPHIIAIETNKAAI